MTDVDPRLHAGAYITDGIELFEVVRRRGAPRGGGFAIGGVLVQNCRTLCTLELLIPRIRTAFRLVRAAPDPHCPDVVDDIVWEPAAVSR